MKILFIGSVKFSESALLKLINIGANIIGVVTKKRSPFNSDFVDLSYIASKHKIPFIHVNSANSQEAVNFIKGKMPDVIYCFGWSEILRKHVLEIPKIGVIGFHPAKLPYNRGRHPIIWALFLGLTETASTFFLMDEGIDTGDIISQEVVPIKYEDDASTLYQKITSVALKQIETFTKQLKEGKIVRYPQPKIGNYWRKRYSFDGIIDFRMTSRAIYNLIRALTKPYVGADVRYRDRLWKVWKSKEEIVDLPNIEPGKVLKVEENKILVKCYQNAIWLLDHEIKPLPEPGEYML